MTTKGTFTGADGKFRTYEIKDDGSVFVDCYICGKQEFLPANHPRAIQYNQVEGAITKHICLDCWKKQQDEKWEAIKNEKRNDVILGQAFNKAVDTIIALYPDELKKGGEEIKKLLVGCILFYEKVLKEIYESKNNSNL